MTVIQLINAFVRTQKKPYQTLSESLIANGLSETTGRFLLLLRVDFGTNYPICLNQCLNRKSV